eukprot:TRINITY_DN25736_c0_g1_i1.p1 TRINITY_DN25736_c0_g1~~TRINITY_DN25736_c0_g1_i1.p1  ORF type:complete len:1103 (-),score=189.58 TRINITY_DN25736_c0_g1_i1:90-3398(-)
MRRGVTPVGSDEDGLDAEYASSAINPMALKLEELRKLKSQFQDADGNQIKLTQEQFVDAFSSRLNLSGETSQHDLSRRRAELCTLFKKVDASCSDTVNWEQFTNYMLFYVPADGFNGQGATELSQGSGVDALAGAWGAGHADMIESICIVNDLGTGNSSGGSGAGGGGNARRYITAGRDGFVKVWHPNLTLSRAIDVGQTTTWLSACCWMSKKRRLAVAATDFRIYFYDSSFSQVTQMEHKEGTPVSLGYTESHDSKSSDREILMIGDEFGWVSVYNMEHDWGDQEPKLEDRKPDDKKANPHASHASRVRHHTDWVTKVGFVSQLQAMVTSSLDGEINLCDIQYNKRKDGRDAVRLHKKGVHSWCWCERHKFFASGGADRVIILWEPYTQKAINQLNGHNAPVLDVLVNEAQHQLISMSQDKVVKVWDILNYQCIQTFTDKTEYKPENKLTRMAFDEDGPALVLCSSLINVLPVSVKVETSRTHLAPIIGALYNDVFDQIISGDNLGTVSVWDLRTGRLEFEFRRAHQDHKMTCMAFDESKRCLYTGAEDGAVKHWNFSSGQQLRTFSMKQPAEIISLLWAREGPNSFVVCLAWDRRIYVWPDSKKQNVEPQYILEDSSGQGHTDDVNCLNRLSSTSGLLATGGDDGYVCFWKIQETDYGAGAGGATSRRYRLSDTTESKAQKSDLAPLTSLEPPSELKTPARRNKKQSGGPGAKNALLDDTVEEDQTAHRSRASKVPLGQGSGIKGADTGKRGSQTAHIVGYPHLSNPTGTLDSQRGSDEPHLPEELSVFEGSTSLGAAGVERMIFLEHKEFLLSTHSDRRVRLWSTRRSEFSQQLDLLRQQTPEDLKEEGKTDADSSSMPSASSSSRGTLVRAQHGSITALYADSEENQWFFSGHADGWVRVWDLKPLQPDKCPGYIVQLRAMQPHRLPVTHIQHFTKDDRVFIVTASADWTIALHTMDGRRIGHLGQRGKPWKLNDIETWVAIAPEPEEGFRGPEDDDGWGVSPRRAGKSGGAPHRQNPANSGGLPGTGGGIGMRTPRGSKVRSRPVIAAQHYSGQGDFGKLSVVERFKPDTTIADQEKQRLAKWHVGGGSHLWGGSRK